MHLQPVNKRTHSDKYYKSVMVVKRELSHFIMVSPPLHYRHFGIVVWKMVLVPYTVNQHPQPLPARGQQHPPTALSRYRPNTHLTALEWLSKMSPDITKYPGGQN